jgi:hypothetical protein
MARTAPFKAHPHSQAPLAAALRNQVAATTFGPATADHASRGATDRAAESRAAASRPAKSRPAKSRPAENRPAESRLGRLPSDITKPAAMGAASLKKAVSTGNAARLKKASTAKASIARASTARGHVAKGRVAKGVEAAATRLALSHRHPAERRAETAATPRVERAITRLGIASAVGSTRFNVLTVPTAVAQAVAITGARPTHGALIMATARVDIMKVVATCTTAA